MTLLKELEEKVIIAQEGAIKELNKLVLQLEGRIKRQNIFIESLYKELEGESH